MDRNAKVLAAVNRGMRIIEIGPSSAPIVPKREGWNAVSVDHATREELVEKYREDPGVNTNSIEEVDVTWSHGPLDAAFPADQLGSFDACIASHVIEHIPDPIGLCKSLERLLKPKGVLSLVIPDKRFCFDFFKPLTSVGELLEAHAVRAVRHSRKTRYDYEAYSVQSAGEFAWGKRPATEVGFYLSLEEARRRYDGHRTDEAGQYADCHAWHFTPSSFELAVLELAAIGELDFRVERSFPVEGFEFYVTLRRERERLEPEMLEARRLELLHRTLLEVREQTDFLPEVIAAAQASPKAGQPLAEQIARLRGTATTVRQHVRARTRLRAAAAAARRRVPRRRA